MKAKPDQPIDLAKADELLKVWRKKHDTPEKVDAAHRKVREPVEKERQGSLLTDRS